jgi:hypothetical protein
MKHAIAYLLTLISLLIVCSSFFVWWTKHEVIFPQRSAPKFVFDVFKSGVMLPFLVFWA